MLGIGANLDPANRYKLDSPAWVLILSERLWMDQADQKLKEKPMKRRFVAGLIPIFLALPSPAYADIYAFVDQNGVRHLSNVPSDPRYKLVMRTPVYTKQAATPSSYAPSNLYTKAALANVKDGVYPGTTTLSANPNAQRSLARRPLRVNEQNRQRFAADVNAIAAQYGLEPALMHAVISAESSYNPWAVSPKGAMGLMQLMPGTAERFGVTSPYDPVSNMHGGARYLRWLMKRFNDPRLAVAAYNAGEGAVQKYGNQIPPYQETQTYVVRVMDYYQRYQTGGGYNPGAVAMNTAYPTRTPANPYLRSGGGVTIITPRNGRVGATILTNTAGRTDTKNAPRTYLTPTGDRVIVGSSSGQRQTMRTTSTKVPVVTIPMFAGNDR